MNGRPSDDDDPRAACFREYVRRLHQYSVRAPRIEGERYACPCCRYLTLEERGGHEICPVCFWEDDGQDQAEADVVRGGSNAELSLTQARSNFALFGACAERFRADVRKPEPDEVPVV